MQKKATCEQQQEDERFLSLALSSLWCAIGVMGGIVVCLGAAMALLLIIETRVFGEEPQSISEKDKAKATLALARAAKERADKEEEAEKQNAKIAIEKAEKGECLSDLKASMAAAKALKKPLVLWVGLNCEKHKDVRNALSECVHCHLESYHGSNSPRLIVTDKQGVEYKIEKFDWSTPIGVRARMGLDVAKPRPRAIVVEEGGG